MVRTVNTIQHNSILHDDNAVSELVGYVILVGIIITGLSIMILMNMPSVISSQDNAQFSHTEQAFTTADSRISKARFSTSIYQETPFQLDEGTVIVDGSDTDSYIEIYKETVDLAHRLYRVPLGTLKCVNDHGEVAYQGGGVWERSPDGGSVMISPPDFDYNGETLTLPIMSIVGTESMATSAGGKVLVDVQSIEPAPNTYVIYPDASRGANPVEQGKDIIVRIKSDYYQAWADFINERTRATATVDPANKIVTSTLTTGTPTQSGEISSGFTTKNMVTDNEYAPIEIFTIDLVKRNNGKDYQIFLRSPDTSDPQLILSTERFHGPGKEKVALIYEYTDNRDAGNPIHEAFSTTLYFEAGTYENENLPIDLLDNTPMVYGDKNGDGNMDNDIDDTSASWGTNPVQRGGDDGTFIGLTNGNDVTKTNPTKSLSDVTQHYLRLMAVMFPSSGPDYESYGTENGQNMGKHHYSVQDSDFLLQFKSRQDLKYLYVTQGNIAVTLRTAG